ncbi:LysR family transcriptional regulator [Catenuloplanes japonicus]|uniref:LysR family transcriptional regulator n=1 Tax=Catenuloplanes japonicus TaxID=33876 RepID=UPI000523F4D9|nr:LysR family transcriptional regulator [Catenuloplanes japonicus]
MGDRREPSIHQLRLLLGLASHLHFGRAAEALKISQSALSMQIRALEERLGVRLIERTSRTAELTTAGRALLPAIEEAVGSIDRLLEAAAARSADLDRELIVGAVDTEAAMPHTAAILRRVQTGDPPIRVSVRSIGFVDQIRALTSGKVDVAFLRPPLPPGIDSLQLATEPRVACLAANDPLARAGRPVPLSRLGRHLVLDVPAGVPRDWWSFWAADPRPDGSAVTYGPVVGDLDALLKAVAEGRGIAFLPAAARTVFARPGIAYLDVTDLPPSTSALAWLAENGEAPAVAAIRAAAWGLLKA